MTDNQPRGLTSLAELVSARRAALGNKPYRTIAAEAGIAVATVHKIAQGKLTRVPSPRTIAGLSLALGIPEQTLIEAAAADIGLREFHVTEGTRRAIYLATEDLTPDEHRMVLDMVNTIRARRLVEQSG